MVSEVRYTGRLKFFDENQSYGFIVMDDDGCDLFVHYDDLKKAKCTKEILRKAKSEYTIWFSFAKMDYMGKYNKSKKAVDLKLMKMEPITSEEFAAQAQYPPSQVAFNGGAGNYYNPGYAGANI
jgi:hypothetical protein